MKCNTPAKMLPTYCVLQNQAVPCKSRVYLAGPASKDGLHLKSFRVQNGLSGTVQLDRKYQAFPGIINGGIVSALFDCHGNWWVLPHSVTNG